MLRGVLVLIGFLTAAAAAIHGAVTSTRGAGWRKLHAGAALDARSGGLDSLLQARLTGLRLAVAQPDDSAVLADLAFISASLVHHFNVGHANESETFVAKLAGKSLSPGAAAGLAAARALLALDAGRIADAEALARSAAGHDEDDLRPRLVQARARLLAGDPVGASKIAQAAAVLAPEARAPLVLYAQARLDLGQAPAARAALRDLIVRHPGDTRALLLDAQARQSLGERLDAPASAALKAACARDGALAPVLAAECALVEAVEARLAGDRGRALARARVAAAGVVREPRALARAAVALAQLGRIDEAEAAAARAAQGAAARLPALGWARLAVALGRGEVLPRRPALRPADPELALLAARLGFAVTGPHGLARELAALGSLRAADPDLRALALLVPADKGAAATGAHAGGETSPVHAYVAGLRARLGGDLPAAARSLGAALAGHGDACRAAGEYLVVMRLLRRPVGSELDELRAADRACINLTLPPPRAAGDDKRKPAPR